MDKDVSHNDLSEEVQVPKKVCQGAGWPWDKEEILRCKRCHAGCFCSRKCQKSCWEEHKVMCDYIVQLESHLTQQCAKVHHISKSTLPPKEEMKLVKLVGRRCTADVLLNEKKVKVLWDTGADVAIVSRSWLEENFPGEELKDVSKLVGHQLFLKVANNSFLNYIGYAEFVFNLSEGAKPLKVPILVTEDELGLPIIGYNVIEEAVKGLEDKLSAVHMLTRALVGMDEKKAEAVVNFIQTNAVVEKPEQLGIVKTGNKNVVIPKGRNLKMKCVAKCGLVNEDTPVLFEPNLGLDLESGLVVGEGVVVLERGKRKVVVPVCNPTDADIVLQAGTPVGIVSSVASVIPCPVEVNSVKCEKGGSESESDCEGESSGAHSEASQDSESDDGASDSESTIPDDAWMKKIDVSHLSPEQQRLVKAMLRRNADVFSKDIV